MAFAVEEQPASSSGPEERPGFIARGRIRRRIRFLRKARELAYRDLGGLVFNLHRFGQRNDALVLAKLTTLGHIDSELRGLERTAHEPQPLTVLSEAGITACARCAAIHSSEDRFCPNCGLPLHRHAELPADIRAGQAPAASPQSPSPPPPGPSQAGARAPLPPAAGARGAPASPPTSPHPAVTPPAEPAPTSPPPSAWRSATGSPPPAASPPAASPPADEPAAPPSPAEPPPAEEPSATPPPATPPPADDAGDDESTAIIHPPANRP